MKNYKYYGLHSSARMLFSQILSTKQPEQPSNANNENCRSIHSDWLIDSNHTNLTSGVNVTSLEYLL